MKTKKIMKVNLSRIKMEIAKQYGSAYKYAQENEIPRCDVSTFLNQTKPVTLKQIEKHCELLGLQVSVKILKKRS